MFSDDIVVEQDLCIEFKSDLLEFTFWVNTYFFQNFGKLSRELPKISNSEHFGAELQIDELDNFKAKFEEGFSVILMGYI